MPAFSCMFRHHLPSLGILKSHLSSRYRSFRHLLSNRSGPKSVPSDSGTDDGPLRSYSSLESSQKWKKQSKSLPALHSRLGQLDTLRTYIRGGHKSETLEDGIHVTRDIEQGWQHKSTITEEKAWGLGRIQSWRLALESKEYRMEMRTGVVFMAFGTFYLTVFGLIGLILTIDSYQKLYITFYKSLI